MGKGECRVGVWVLSQREGQEEQGRSCWGGRHLGEAGPAPSVGVGWGAEQTQRRRAAAAVLHTLKLKT